VGLGLYWNICGKGQTILFEDIAIGNFISIIYEGLIIESNPALINGVILIQIVEATDFK